MFLVQRSAQPDPSDPPDRSDPTDPHSGAVPLVPYVLSVPFVRGTRPDQFRFGFRVSCFEFGASHARREGERPREPHPGSARLRRTIPTPGRLYQTHALHPTTGEGDEGPRIAGRLSRSAAPGSRHRATPGSTLALRCSQPTCDRLLTQIVHESRADYQHEPGVGHGQARLLLKRMPYPILVACVSVPSINGSARPVSPSSIGARLPTTSLRVMHASYDSPAPYILLPPAYPHIRSSRIQHEASALRPLLTVHRSLASAPLAQLSTLHAQLIRPFPPFSVSS